MDRKVSIRFQRGYVPHCGSDEETRCSFFEFQSAFNAAMSHTGVAVAQLVQQYSFNPLSTRLCPTLVLAVDDTSGISFQSAFNAAMSHTLESGESYTGGEVSIRFQRGYVPHCFFKKLGTCMAKFQSAFNAAMSHTWRSSCHFFASISFNPLSTRLCPTQITRELTLLTP